MSSSAELHVAYKVGNAPIQPYPYPHVFIESIFPEDFYARMQEMLPDPKCLLPLEQARGVRGYDERFVLEFKEEQFAHLTREQDTFWRELHRWMVGGRFTQLLLGKFGPLIAPRFRGEPDVRFHDELMLVQDTTHYKLGPHTDAQRKVLTLLFYLPRDRSQEHMGTSIYQPKDREFRCPGGPHHPHEKFDRMWTMPFRPNSLFAFVKSDVSFHGVEPVTDADTRRWLMLYDIYVKRQ
ncbi:MAG TPA: hypothetical protein VEC19_18190 [Usitatibacter sp.]|nr:hypothetical protein [Usitatibacter sp.]